MSEEETAEMEDKVQEVAKKHGFEVVLHRAPEDPERKKEWIQRMIRLQVGIWINDGAKCAHCNHVYTDIEDFHKRNSKCGFYEKDDPNYFDKMFVCSECWDSYVKNRGVEAEGRKRT